jgi:hypothetical protein
MATNTKKQALDWTLAPAPESKDHDHLSVG